MNIDKPCLNSCQIIHVNNSINNFIPPVAISHMNATNDNNVQGKDTANTRTHLSLSIKDHVDQHNSDMTY